MAAFVFVGDRVIGGPDDFHLVGVSRVMQHVGEEGTARWAGRLSLRRESGRARGTAEELAISWTILPIREGVDKWIDNAGGPGQDRRHDVDNWYFSLLL